MSTPSPTLPLAGYTVVEIMGGAAAACATRMLADAGASVTQYALSAEQRDVGVIRLAGDPVEAAYAAYLRAGKRDGGLCSELELAGFCARADLVIIGEDARIDATRLKPRIGSVRLNWFGSEGEYSGWQGNDLIVQALTALPHMVGPVEGPPLQFGDRQSTTVAAVTTFIAALSAVLARPAAAPRRFDLSILEANLVLSEMHMHFFERDGLPMTRNGLNRFAPNSPVGIYPCKTGWVGITCTTPQQWQSLCVALEMREMAADPALVTRELRFARLDEVEDAMRRALAARTAFEWAAAGREHKVPIVVVPDAPGMLSHPIFKARSAFARFQTQGREFQVPRLPLALTATPIRERLDGAAPAADTSAPKVPDRDAAPVQAATSVPGDPPLAGVTVADFTMGWAGPLAARMLGDLGATLLKIEAGRYPDWWRGVNWTREYIETRAYENAKPFLGLNRGKLGTSIDLTTAAGREIALSLVAQSEIVIENQAAGVMAKMGLGYETLVKVNPEVVMVSMSAFGIGNEWSDTRAYGSTLEQGSGLPSFVGREGDPPTMLHLAYGDPVGGLFGCAAALAALVHKRRSGHGQLVNVSMIEAMMQFTTPSLLEYQLTHRAPRRRGNRHALYAPHGIYPAQGKDRWVAVFCADARAFSRLAALVGRPDWANDAALATLAGRQAREDEIDAAIGAWTSSRAPEAAARELQAAGIGAAPVFHAEELWQNAHLQQSGFFIELEREFSGPQRQCGVSIRQGGARLGARQPAPLLGEHSWAVFSRYLGMSRARFDELVAERVITFAPTEVRNANLK